MQPVRTLPIIITIITTMIHPITAARAVRITEDLTAVDTMAADLTEEAVADIIEFGSKKIGEQGRIFVFCLRQYLVLARSRFGPLANAPLNAGSRVLRSLFFLCLLSCAASEAAGALSTAAPVPASNPSGDSAEQSLATLLNRTNLHPRAFVEDHKIRIYFTNDDRVSMLTAAWKPPRLTAETFVYSSATLQAGKSPKPIPDANSPWHEVTVVPRAESDRLIHKVADRLVPTEPGHGIFCRFALGEATVYRDADGQVQVAAQTNPPVNVTIDRRYTRQEFASAAAAELETDLKAAHPGQTTFILAIGRGNTAAPRVPRLGPKARRHFVHPAQGR